MGRDNVLRRAGGDVISGGSGGWLAFEAGEMMAGGDVAAGGEVDDMTAVMVV